MHIHFNQQSTQKYKKKKEKPSLSHPSPFHFPPSLLMYISSVNSLGCNYFYPFLHPACIYYSHIYVAIILLLVDTKMVTLVIPATFSFSITNVSIDIKLIYSFFSCIVFHRMDIPHLLNRSPVDGHIGC